MTLWWHTNEEVQKRRPHLWRAHTCLHTLSCCKHVQLFLQFDCSHQLNTCNIPGWHAGVVWLVVDDEMANKAKVPRMNIMYLCFIFNGFQIIWKIMIIYYISYLTIANQSIHCMCWYHSRLWVVLYVEIWTKCENKIVTPTQIHALVHSRPSTHFTETKSKVFGSLITNKS